MCSEKGGESWEKAPDRPVLEQNGIHVYRCQLTGFPVETFSSCLSGQEKERAARFQHDHLCRRFIASHGFLRHILAAYHKTAPEALEYSFNKYGKPYLTKNNAAIWFNLAHSADMALVAVTRIGEIGVDVEQLREVSQAWNIADKYFHPQEKTVLQTSDKAVFPSLFLSMWTKKEACIKAVGKGLAQSLTAFNTAGENPVTVPEQSRPEGDKQRKLMLASLQPAKNYLGAVAVEGESYTLSCFTYQPAPAHSSPPSGDHKWAHRGPVAACRAYPKMG